jgi:secreted PhoX family phosphatase
MSLDNDRGGVAVLRNDVGEFKLLRTYEVDCEAHGKAMSEEARLLAVASEHIGRGCEDGSNERVREVPLTHHQFSSFDLPHRLHMF